MWFFIVTIRSILWMLVSLIATLLMVHTVLSPYWLIGLKQTVTATVNGVKINSSYTPSIGVYSKCGAPTSSSNFTMPNCILLAGRGLLTEPQLFPTIWKIATVCVATGIVIMCATIFMSVVTCCVQSISKKSIFTISGTIQVIAGIFYILGIMLFPIGWDTDRVVQICGGEALPYYPGDCHLGSGMYLAVLGTILTFVAGPLAVLADKSTSTNSVQDRIDDGDTFICLV